MPHLPCPFARPPPCPARRPPPCRSTIADNALTGPIPDSWAQLPTLSQVTLQPGNPGLCPVPPLGAAFRVCASTSLICSGRDALPYDSAVCEEQATGTGGGGSFPTAAVAVPLAVVCVATLAGLALLAVRRRRRAVRQRHAAAAPKRAVYQASRRAACGG